MPALGWLLNLGFAGSTVTPDPPSSVALTGTFSLSESLTATYSLSQSLTATWEE